MSPEDRQFLRAFFQAAADRPLDPDDPQYVHLYENESLAEDDPVELLARGIEWTPGKSVQLLSGFRGTGKSTELRRLRKRLRDGGFLVVLLDIEDYVNLSTPVDVSDFLMALAGAFGEALRDPTLLGDDPGREDYWERLVSFLARTEVEISEISGEPGGVGLKATLKSDPSFKQRLQKRMAGHLGALVRHVHGYMTECVRALKEKHGPERDVVLLVDSVEHIRGTSANAQEVHQSVEVLFAGHADKLHLPSLHVIYTVPPYLKVRYPNLGALYAPGGIQLLPAVKVKTSEGETFQPGLDALAQIVEQRGDCGRLLGGREVLDELSSASGGHLRDLLRIIAEVARRARQLPVREETVRAALNQIRNEFLPIADDDAVWLHEVARTRRASLDNAERLPDLARFLDTHLVLCYHNGREWYDVHPLIAGDIEAQAAEIATRRRRTAERNGENGDGG